MALVQLDTENADRDIKSASIAVLTHTPTVNAMCIGLIMLGDGAKNLAATGGAFQLVITVGGQTVQPSPQSVTFSTAVRAAIWTTPFPVPANAEVIMKILSPNAADADVDCTAYLYDTTYALPDAVAGATGGLPTTNGTKQTQTVDLTAGQTIAATVADKTEYSLAATGLDLVTATSTFGVAIIAGIWAAATSGMSTVGSIGKKLADWVILTSQAIADALKLAPTAGAPAADSVNADLDTLKTGQALQATETNLNTKIPTALSFTGANVNAESKVTAAPTGMSTLAAGAQMDLVNAPNATAVTAIQAGLSKPDTAQAITAADTTAATTAQATIAKVGGLIEFATHDRFTAAALETAPAGSGLSAQETRDAMKLAPTEGAPAAGSIDKQLDDVPTDVDTTITASHGAGAYGGALTYANTITLITQKADLTRIPTVSITFKNASGTGIQSTTTDLNGAGTTTLSNGAVTVIPTASGYTFAVTTVTISGNQTITMTGAALSITQPSAGTQTVYYIPDDPSLIIDTTAVVTAGPVDINQTLNDAIFTGDTITAITRTTHYEMALAIGGKFRIKGVRSGKEFLNVVITVTNATTRSLADYISAI